MYIHTFVCMYILHKFIKSSKTYSTYTEEHKEKKALKWKMSMSPQTKLFYLSILS